MTIMTYFDHNATAPLHPLARQAWLEAAESFVGNPSSPHRLGGRADAALETARGQLAEWLECHPHQIVWTSGATESNNLALHHLADTLPSDATLCLSQLEHPSVIETAVHYFGPRVRWIPVLKEGLVDLDWLADELNLRRPGAVATMAANNVTGVIQPWQRIARMCSDHGIPYLCDAVQWIGRMPFTGLGACDYVSGCAHKVGGVRGIGFLKCPSVSPLRPLILGGPQEESRRAGTENVPGALALVALLRAREEMGHEREGRLQMRDRFIQRLTTELPGTELVGMGADRLWNTVSALLPEVDCRQRWVVKIDKMGASVSTGSACSSGKEEPSPVLLAMGYAPAQAGRVVRFSSGWETVDADWRELLMAVNAAWVELQKLRA